MAKKSRQDRVLALLAAQQAPLKLADIQQQVGDVPERTLRRWLGQWCDQGRVLRVGRGRATAYSLVAGHALSSEQDFHFLSGFDSDIKTTLLDQIRELWTHHSTAIEGNTLSLGDTHFILHEGLTISGKPLKDHQEIIGHSSAIDLIYQSVQTPVSDRLLFDLHKAVQTQVVTDIYKPQGAWKLEPNGTYAVDSQGKQQFIQYALPAHVGPLMAMFVEAINSEKLSELTVDNAPTVYARYHMAFVHVHPFWDGNGRLARLVANIPLLKAGLPPLMLATEKRRDYIELLADYQIAVGQLTPATGLWPEPDTLESFEQFCTNAYQQTHTLLDKARQQQIERERLS